MVRKGRVIYASDDALIVGTFVCWFACRSSFNTKK